MTRIAPTSRLQRVLIFAFILLPLPALAQNFTIDWYTVDGGGAMRTTGGSFELSGTIGQPDASSFSMPMTGGSFELVGGFWVVARDVCSLLGDLNLDGQRDGLDVQGFVNCILNVNGANCSCADLDGNSQINTTDASLFVNVLLN